MKKRVDGWTERGGVYSFSSLLRVAIQLFHRKRAICGNFRNLCYHDLLNTHKPDYLKEGLLEFVKSGPKNLDECVVEGGHVLKRNGFKGSSNTDDFRMRVFEKLSQLTAVGYVKKDRSVKPPLFQAV